MESRNPHTLQLYSALKNVAAIPGWPAKDIVPTLAMLGMQSAGKTTVIECFTKFPVGTKCAQTGTRCPIRYVLSHGDNPYFNIGGNQVHSQEEIEIEVDKHNKRLAKSVQFSPHELKVVVTAPNLPRLDITDLPGLQTQQDDPEHEKHRMAILEIVRDFAADTRVTPVVVLKATEGSKTNSDRQALFGFLPALRDKKCMYFLNFVNNHLGAGKAMESVEGVNAYFHDHLALLKNVCFGTLAHSAARAEEQKRNTFDQKCSHLRQLADLENTEFKDTVSKQLEQNAMLAPCVMQNFGIATLVRRMESFISDYVRKEAPDASFNIRQLLHKIETDQAEVSHSLEKLDTSNKVSQRRNYVRRWACTLRDLQNCRQSSCTQNPFNPMEAARTFYEEADALRLCSKEELLDMFSTKYAADAAGNGLSSIDFSSMVTPPPQSPQLRLRPNMSSLSMCSTSASSPAKSTMSTSASPTSESSEKHDHLPPEESIPPLPGSLGPVEAHCGRLEKWCPRRLTTAVRAWWPGVSKPPQAAGIMEYVRFSNDGLRKRVTFTDTKPLRLDMVLGPDASLARLLQVFFAVAQRIVTTIDISESEALSISGYATEHMRDKINEPAVVKEVCTRPLPNYRNLWREMLCHARVIYEHGPEAAHTICTSLDDFKDIPADFQEELTSTYKVLLFKQLDKVDRQFQAEIDRKKSFVGESQKEAGRFGDGQLHATVARRGYLIWASLFLLYGALQCLMFGCVCFRRSEADLVTTLDSNSTAQKVEAGLQIMSWFTPQFPVWALRDGLIGFASWISRSKPADQNYLWETFSMLVVGSLFLQFLFIAIVCCVYFKRARSPIDSLNDIARRLFQKTKDVLEVSFDDTLSKAFYEYVQEEMDRGVGLMFEVHAKMEIYIRDFEEDNIRSQSRAQQKELFTKKKELEERKATVDDALSKVLAYQKAAKGDGSDSLE